jgi:hypothetical protein
MDPIETVTRNEHELTSAERTGDAAALDGMLAADFRGVTLTGAKVDRRQFIATLCSSGLKFTNLEIDDLEVRELGSAVVAAGRSTFVGATGGRHVTGSARFLDVWTPVAGRYRLTYSSVTPIR